MAGHEHSYERLVVDGMPHFVNGLGGQTRRTCRTLLPESKNCYDSNHGAMLVEASTAEIKFQFITQAGVVVDQFLVTTSK